METEKVIPAKRNENNKRRMKIMKKLVVTDKKACMACLACVDACSTAFYKEFDPAKSCIQIVAGKDGEPKTNTCLQCGVQLVKGNHCRGSAKTFNHTIHNRVVGHTKLHSL